MKQENVSRRKFLYSIGMLSVALPLGASALDFIPDNSKSFKFMLLGDIHFDNLNFHDLDYVRSKFSEGDVGQIHEYSRITTENFPALVQVVKETGKNINADFYLQLGDFVEGLCGSQELAQTQTTGFINYMRKEELGRPFLVIKGNHDITGIGARETFHNIVLPWQSKEQEKSMKSANSTFVHKNVRFILFDGYTPDESLEWLKQILPTCNEKTIFFCVHQPVVPFNARSNWHIFGRRNQLKQREELLNLLGQYNAIVLCGHLHKTSIITRSTPKGNFVQICTGSVLADKKGPVKDHLIGREQYGPQLVNLEPDFSPSSLEERKENLDNEKKYIQHFEYADFMGYSTVSISKRNKVDISIFTNVDKKPWKVVNVNHLLKA